MKHNRKQEVVTTTPMTRETYKDDEVIRKGFNFKTLRRLLRYAIPYKWYFIGAFILLVATAIASVFTPMVNSMIIEKVIKDGRLSMLTYLLISLAFIGTIEIISNFFHARMLSKAGQRIVFSLRRDVFEKLQKLSFDYFDNRPTGKILVRVTNYINEIANFFASMMVRFLLDLCRIIIVLTFMFTLDWRLAFMVIASVIPLLFFITILRKAIRSRIAKMRNTDSSRAAFLHENILGNVITNSFNRKDQNLHIYMDDVFLRSKKNFMRYIRIQSLYMPCTEIFINYGTIFLFAFSFFLIGSGSLAIGTVVAFSSYMTMLSEPLTEFASILQNMSDVSTYIERVFDLLDTAVLVQDKEDAETLPEIQGQVDFENVTFGYNPEVPILRNFDLHVKAGECIGLVGPTGAGKSTVINLISRFYDVQKGAVKIDGHDVKDVTLHSLRAQMGIMMQDTFIFKGSILENIRYGTPDATDAQCIEAAKQAFADEFIQKLPNGYYTELNEKGEELSTGERQLLSFARTILRNPKILILDEATSSIDTETERNIQKAMAVILKGRTSFMVAHRLSTIIHADRILYISDGGIKESGNHHELMEKKGLYYSLAQKN